MVKHGSIKSKVVYSKDTVPATVAPPSRTNSNMSGEEIFDYMETLQPEAKNDFMSSLTNQQLNELTKAINRRAAVNSPRGHDLSHLSSEALVHYVDALINSYKKYPLRDSGSGKRNKKRVTRHKKKRGKKTRKY